MIKETVFDTMLSAWNEEDPARIRELAERCVTADVRFVDPANTVNGIDEFIAMIVAFRQKYPGSVVSRTSVIDAHNGRARYTWAIAQNGAVFVVGQDFAAMAESGLVESIDGFFGELAKI